MQIADIDLSLSTRTKGSRSARGENNPIALSFRFGIRGVTAVENGMEIGVVNKPDGQLLKQLASTFTVHMKPWLNYENGSKPKECQLRTIVPMDVDLFGTSTDVVQLGEFLSVRNIYLQEPQRLLLHTPYRNPHLFTVRDDGETPHFSRVSMCQDSDFEQEVETVVNMSRDIAEPSQPIEVRGIKTVLRV